MSTELPTEKLYQALVKRAAQSGKWAEYFLLVNACFEVIQHIPKSSEEFTETDVDEKLIQTLECLGKAVDDVLPGGADEFSQYMPTLTERYQAQRHKRS
jgi:hypothetical protein